jgi:hypothetical protein
MRDYTMQLWTKILTIAARAPSPHNIQPWRIRLHSAHEATLFLDTARIVPKTDHTGSFMTSAMTMLIEAIAIVAANRGYQLQHDLLSPRGLERFQPFAQLVLTPSQAVVPSYPDSALLRRRTSRLPYLPTPVPATAQHALSGLADRWGQHYSQIEDPDQIEAILARNIETLFDDLNDQDYRAELAPWFRISQRQAARERDGLSYRCMNLSPAELWMAAHTPQLMRVRPLRSALHQIYRAQIGPVATLGYLRGPFWERADALKAGQFLMRFWLELSMLNLSIHPFGNMVTNAASAAWMSQLLGQDAIWLLFKIGYSPEPPTSARKLLEEILL